MKELKELSVNYAAEKTNEMVAQIVAQAFADGYRMGYKDREDEIPVDLRDGKTEFVDLGLLSGTLWSADFEKDGEKVKYLPYAEAVKYNIPTKDQFRELLESCHWEIKYINSTSREFTCIGPNGNHIVFRSKGYMLAETCRDFEKIYFWVKSETETSSKEVAYLYYHSGEIKKIVEMFSGNMLPLRLVKNN